MNALSPTNRDVPIPSYFPFAFQLSGKVSDIPNLTDLWKHKPMPGGTLSPSVARTIAARILKQQIFVNQPTDISPGRLLTVNTILRAQRFLLWKHCTIDSPKALSVALFQAETGQNSRTTKLILPRFVRRFPPMTIIGGNQSESDYMSETTDTISNREVISAELILFDITGGNPAILMPLSFLLDDTELRNQTEFQIFIATMDEHFRSGPSVHPLGVSLLDTLRAPALACPQSLEGQLEYIRVNWGSLLPESILNDLLMTISITKEEAKLRKSGSGLTRVLTFDNLTVSSGSKEIDEERFSLDAEWMPNVVLMAKSVYVWLDQLSKELGQEIRLLSDIPDQTLDRLADYGFTGLWLIGLWERSSASQKIKQMSGNPEAAASAYSLFDYTIADDLGGESALDNLKDRCKQRGIRLASDMVPNHTGIFSKWIIEHPDWFLQLDSPPYPGYSFTSNNLSDDTRVVVQIEDGYWDKRDASVVFKRSDTHTGNVRYIYHGNDGTNMPWNDTAQLDFTLAEVREAVIQTILHVARHFPIIRFDAAMTLTRRHFRRLWFPPPGEGGDIPSRSEHGLSDKQFDALFPKEFWREVVERVGDEQPDTLLLAEAFWLMEGYFVRTLGMHRVYNSAFMNMLKLEENDKYRATIQNVLEFSPAILGRFVNFMNNPDEETAVDQFGRQDKYFGVATLLVTMPGLPMFGHGQIEGLTEKYGMEYRRAYRNEGTDDDMVSRHVRQIFPLMHKRYLFSGWQLFTLYDFVNSTGSVDENVFAYSNGNDTEQALVVYNNSYTETSGRIKLSTPINIGDSDNPHLQQRSLVEALGIDCSNNAMYRFRDHISGLEYLRTGSELRDIGLYAELRAYTCHVFMDFSKVNDNDGLFSRLATNLSGSGVASIDKELTALRFEPVLTPFRELLTLLAGVSYEGTSHTLPESTRVHLNSFFTAVAKQEASDASPDKIAQLLETCQRDIENLLTLNSEPDSKLTDISISAEEERQAKNSTSRLALIGWVVLRGTELIAPTSDSDKKSDTSFASNRYDNWLLADQVSSIWTESEAALIRLLLRYEQFFAKEQSVTLDARLKQLLDDSDVQVFLLVNSHDGTLWFNKERFATLINSLRSAAGILETSTASLKAEDELLQQSDEAGQILLAAENAGYRVDQIVLELQTPEH